MSASSSAPSAQPQRFAAYLDSLTQAAGHLGSSCAAGIVLHGSTTSRRTQKRRAMPARLPPDDVQRTHQSLHQPEKRRIDLQQIPGYGGLHTASLRA